MTTAPAGHSLVRESRAGAVPFTIRLIEATDVHHLLAAVADLAAEVFTRPPWAEPRETARAVADRLAADLLMPGFALAAALQGERLHGFAYGMRCSRLALAASRPPRGDFTLKELAVLPSMRGCGLGARLHDTILTAAPATPWWLSTHPQAVAALGLYRHRGWRVAALHRTHEHTRLIMRRESR
ncbi:GNAT family N-acetyltransferase [Nonomuraea rhizosphaerae]|uniref:GNAT family N-acetyltransferase n=1 Tax=Nonomuraea rhizosphaerae TaxID=2665663 RepID=UPI001C5FBCBF|nr:GNAT family N-acetyltransferase [Nonomuraea rhizosphaerae]